MAIITFAVVVMTPSSVLVIRRERDTVIHAENYSDMYSIVFVTNSIIK